MWQRGGWARGTAPRGLRAGSPTALGRDWKDVRSAPAQEGGDCQPQNSDAGESRFLFLPKSFVLHLQHGGARRPAASRRADRSSPGRRRPRAGHGAARRAGRKQTSSPAVVAAAGPWHGSSSPLTAAWPVEHARASAPSRGPWLPELWDYRGAPLSARNKAAARPSPWL